MIVYLIFYQASGIYVVTDCCKLYFNGKTEIDVKMKMVPNREEITLLQMQSAITALVMRVVLS